MDGTGERKEREGQPGGRGRQASRSLGLTSGSPERWPPKSLEPLRGREPPGAAGGAQGRQQAALEEGLSCAEPCQELSLQHPRQPPGLPPGLPMGILLPFSLLPLIPLRMNQRH